MKHLKQMYAALLMTVFTMPAFSGDMLAPPSGARKLFEFGADGVQIYTCKMKDEAHLAQGFAYAFDGPEAVLFDADGKQAGTHGKGPEWVLGDGSSVTGEVLAKQPSPKPGAIPWLLLKVKSHAGAGKLDAVEFVRRIDTDGGAEPADGCGQSQFGTTVRVPYSAKYQFFGK
ncbi:MAG TPA: DUF3455 domain-containing protein [Methylocella sp.]|jgi:hypothetical protein